MSNWLKYSLIIGGTFAVIWLGTIYQWRTNAYLPDSDDVALFFLILPVGVLLGFWFLSKLFRFSRPTPEPVAEAGKQDDANKDTAKTDEQERFLSLAILAAAIRTSQGKSPDELKEKLVSNKASFDLDPELTDSNGYPIMSGRIMDIDENAMLEALTEWDAAKQHTPFEWTPGQLRAIAIGSEIVGELAHVLLEHKDLEAYLDLPPHKREQAALPAVQLIPIIEASWGPEKNQYVSDWFEHLIQQTGWPAEKIVQKPGSKPSFVLPFVAIDQLMVETYRQSISCVSIVVACESNIDPTIIDELESTGKLSTGSNNDGLIPGEGAAGLLLADEHQAGLLGRDSFTKIQRVAKGQRDKSADTKGLVGDSLLTELVQNALAISKLTTENISLITSDTDDRGGRIIELMGMGAKVFPELDPIEHYLKVATACGAIGPAAGLIALALGHDEVENNAGATVCLSNLDSHDRVVVALSSGVNARAPITTNDSA